MAIRTPRRDWRPFAKRLGDEAELIKRWERWSAVFDLLSPSPVTGDPNLQTKADNVGLPYVEPLE